MPFFLMYLPFFLFGMHTGDEVGGWVGSGVGGQVRLGVGSDMHVSHPQTSSITSGRCSHWPAGIIPTQPFVCKSLQVI